MGGRGGERGFGVNDCSHGFQLSGFIVVPIIPIVTQSTQNTNLHQGIRSTLICCSLLEHSKPKLAVFSYSKVRIFQSLFLVFFIVAQ